MVLLMYIAFLFLCNVRVTQKTSSLHPGNSTSIEILSLLQGWPNARYSGYLSYVSRGGMEYAAAETSFLGMLLEF